MQNHSEQKRLMRPVFYAVTLLCATVLAGCASSTPEDPEKTSPAIAEAAPPPASSAPLTSLSPSAEDDTSDPLIDARYRTVITCESEEPMEAGDKLGDVRLVCKGINASATLTEFRDAGWRIEDLKMTEVKTPEGTIVVPLRLTLRKLF